MVDTVFANLILQFVKNLSCDYLGNFIFSPVLLNSTLETISKNSDEGKKVETQFLLSQMSRNRGYVPADDILSDDSLVLFRNFMFTLTDFDASEYFKNLGTKTFYSHVDFTKPSFEHINSVVSKETLGLVSNLNMYWTAKAQLFFLSTAYFQHAWQTSLALDENKLSRFYQCYKNSCVKTAFMKGFAETYTETYDYVGFIKEYSGDRYCFLALLAKDELKMSPPDGEQLYSAMLFRQRQGAEIEIPKFSFEIDTFLKDTLNKHFGPYITLEIGSSEIEIDKIIQKSKIVVDEHGLSAGVQPSPALKPEKVVLDRPFWFFVIDKAFGEIILIGRFACPQSD